MHLQKLQLGLLEEAGDTAGGCGPVVAEESGDTAGVCEPVVAEESGDTAGHHGPVVTSDEVCCRWIVLGAFHQVDVLFPAGVPHSNAICHNGPDEGHSLTVMGALIGRMQFFKT